MADGKRKVRPLLKIPEVFPEFFRDLWENGSPGMTGGFCWIPYILVINKRKASRNLPGRDEDCSDFDSMIDTQSGFCHTFIFGSFAKSRFSSLLSVH
jgi:hypothetical protein